MSFWEMDAKVKYSIIAAIGLVAVLILFVIIISVVCCCVRKRKVDKTVVPYAQEIAVEEVEKAKEVKLKDNVSSKKDKEAALKEAELEAARDMVVSTEDKIRKKKEKRNEAKRDIEEREANIRKLEANIGKKSKNIDGDIVIEKGKEIDVAGKEELEKMNAALVEQKSEMQKLDDDISAKQNDLSQRKAMKKKAEACVLQVKTPAEKEALWKDACSKVEKEGKRVRLLEKGVYDNMRSLRKKVQERASVKNELDKIEKAVTKLEEKAIKSKKKKPQLNAVKAEAEIGVKNKVELKKRLYAVEKECMELCSEWKDKINGLDTYIEEARDKYEKVSDNETALYKHVIAPERSPDEIKKVTREAYCNAGVRLIIVKQSFLIGNELVLQLENELSATQEYIVKRSQMSEKKKKGVESVEGTTEDDELDDTILEIQKLNLERERNEAKRKKDEYDEALEFYIQRKEKLGEAEENTNYDKLAKEAYVIVENIESELEQSNVYAKDYKEKRSTVQFAKEYEEERLVDAMEEVKTLLDKDLPNVADAAVSLLQEGDYYYGGDYESVLCDGAKRYGISSNQNGKIFNLMKRYAKIKYQLGWSCKCISTLEGMSRENNIKIQELEERLLGAIREANGFKAKASDEYKKLRYKQELYIEEKAKYKRLKEIVEKKDADIALLQNSLKAQEERLAEKQDELERIEKRVKLAEGDGDFLLEYEKYSIIKAIEALKNEPALSEEVIRKQIQDLSEESAVLKRELDDISKAVDQVKIEIEEEELNHSRYTRNRIRKDDVIKESSLCVGYKQSFAMVIPKNINDVFQLLPEGVKKGVDGAPKVVAEEIRDVELKMGGIPLKDFVRYIVELAKKPKDTRRIEFPDRVKIFYRKPAFIDIMEREGQSRDYCVDITDIMFFDEGTGIGIGISGNLSVHIINRNKEMDLEFCKAVVRDVNTPGTLYMGIGNHDDCDCVPDDISGEFCTFYDNLIRKLSNAKEDYEMKGIMRDGLAQYSNRHLYYMFNKIGGVCCRMNPGALRTHPQEQFYPVYGSSILHPKCMPREMNKETEVVKGDYVNLKPDSCAGVAQFFYENICKSESDAKLVTNSGKKGFSFRSSAYYVSLLHDTHKGHLNTQDPAAYLADLEKRERSGEVVYERWPDHTPEVSDDVATVKSSMFKSAIGKLAAIIPK